MVFYRRINISSDDPNNVKSDPNNNNAFQIILSQNTGRNVFGARVVQFNFLNDIYTVRAGVNDRFDFSTTASGNLVGGVVVPAGIYTVSLLTSQINSIINGHDAQMSASYNTTLNRIEIVSSNSPANQFTITEVSNSLLPIMGFIGGNAATGARKGERGPNMTLGISHVYLASGVLHEARYYQNRGKIDQSIIGKFETPEPGQEISIRDEEDFPSVRYKRPRPLETTIDFKLIFEDGTLVDNNNATWGAEIILFIADLE